jgi:hypothetical protein
MHGVSGPDSTVAKESQTIRLEVVNPIYSDTWRLSQGKPARVHLCCRSFEIRDTWLKFSSLETLKQRWITQKHRKY